MNELEGTYLCPVCKIGILSFWFMNERGRWFKCNNPECKQGLREEYILEKIKEEKNRVFCPECIQKNERRVLVDFHGFLFCQFCDFTWTRKRRFRT